jgi:hypothetical protein
MPAPIHLDCDQQRRVNELIQSRLQRERTRHEALMTDLRLRHEEIVTQLLERAEHAEQFNLQLLRDICEIKRRAEASLGARVWRFINSFILFGVHK